MQNSLDDDDDEKTLILKCSTDCLLILNIIYKEIKHLRTIILFPTFRILHIHNWNSYSGFSPFGLILYQLILNIQCPHSK